MTRRCLVVLALAAGVGGCGGTRTTTATVTVARTVTVTRTATAPAPAAAACAADALVGVFAVVPGSAGAGQITYRLRLTNESGGGCWLSGLPDARLLDAAGAPLPTAVTADRPGEPSPRVLLAPGASAAADARFSPDVTGVGDNQTGVCEPTAATLRVAAPGGGTVDAPVRPRTPVCERGGLRFRPFAAS